MLRKVSGKPDERFGQGDQLATERGLSVETGLGESLGQSFFLFGYCSFDSLCQPVDDRWHHPECPRNIADGRADAIADHHGGHADPLPAIFAVHVLQHLFAALVFKIDIDIGRFVPLAAHKSLKEQIHSLRVDCCNPQAVADDGIGRRSTTLTEDAAMACKADQVPDGEEVGFVAKLRDQVELVPDAPVRLFRDPIGITLPRTAHRQFGQGHDRGRPRRHQLLGIFVTELIE